MGHFSVVGYRMVCLAAIRPVSKRTMKIYVSMRLHVVMDCEITHEI